MTNTDNILTRIAILYDGTFFHHVSNYYNFDHNRQSRIDFSGLHKFVRHKIAEEEDTEVKFCQIVDAHYFRGRKPSREANILPERQFDEVLMRSGITTHYAPINRMGAEKQINVWLAVEALELVMLNRCNVVVIVAGDSDYIPVLRKISTYGVRVLVLGWDLRVSGLAYEMETHTSRALLDEATYAVMMSEIINTAPADDQLVNNLFIRKNGLLSTSESTEDFKNETFSIEPRPSVYEDMPLTFGSISFVNQEKNYGFIQIGESDERVFYHGYQVDFPGILYLNSGMNVSFYLGLNHRGKCAIKVRGLDEISATTSDYIDSDLRL